MYTIKQETIALENAREEIVSYSVNEVEKHMLFYKLQERKKNQEIIGTYLYKNEKPKYLLEINFKDKE